MKIYGKIQFMDVVDFGQQITSRTKKQDRKGIWKQT